MARLVESRKTELGCRIRAGADEFVAKDRIAGFQWAFGAGEFMGDVVMRFGGRTDVLLRVSDAASERTNAHHCEQQSARIRNCPLPPFTTLPLPCGGFGSIFELFGRDS